MQANAPTPTPAPTPTAPTPVPSPTPTPAFAPTQATSTSASPLAQSPASSAPAQPELTTKSFINGIILALGIIIDAIIIFSSYGWGLIFIIYFSPPIIILNFFFGRSVAFFAKRQQKVKPSRLVLAVWMSLALLFPMFNCALIVLLSNKNGVVEMCMDACSKMSTINAFMQYLMFSLITSIIIITPMFLIGALTKLLSKK